MIQEKVLEEFSALPLEAQRQVLDFIAFLRSRATKKDENGQRRQTPLRDEPFIGMWQDRADMENSSDWVRTVRAKEWSNLS